VSVSAQMEREEALLEQQLEDGQITYKEYQKELRELQRDYAAAADEAAYEAAQAERERWY
jgi:hypothetical protein